MPHTPPCRLVPQNNDQIATDRADVLAERLHHLVVLRWRAQEGYNCPTNTFTKKNGQYSYDVLSLEIVVMYIDYIRIPSFSLTFEQKRLIPEFGLVISSVREFEIEPSPSLSFTPLVLPIVNAITWIMKAINRKQMFKCRQCLRSIQITKESHSTFVCQPSIVCWRKPKRQLDGLKRQCNRLRTAFSNSSQSQQTTSGLLVRTVDTVTNTKNLQYELQVFTVYVTQLHQESV